MKTNVEKFRELVAEMSETYEKKNADYGDSFGDSLNEFGLVAGVVRLGDKFNRIKSLSKQDARVKSESIRDTLLDLANYAVMCTLWLDKQQKPQPKVGGKACCANCSFNYTHCENGVIHIRCVKNKLVNMSQKEAEANNGCLQYEARGV